MAPKNKVDEPEKKPLIGRVGTNLRAGIVGVPNVGKSTFFNVLTKSAAPAENFPFCTIDPNENKYPENWIEFSKFFAHTKLTIFLCFFLNDARRVPVPDARFDYLCEYHKPAR